MQVINRIKSISKDVDPYGNRRSGMHCRAGYCGERLRMIEPSFRQSGSSQFILCEPEDDKSTTP